MNYQKKELVYTLDDNYLVPFLVSAFSVKKFLNPDVKIIIVQPFTSNSEMGLTKDTLDICQKSLRAIDVIFEIVYIDVESFPEEKLPLWARFPKTTWLRYYYIFNAEITQKTIYYVEADMIFQKSSPNIFEVELGDKAVSGRVSPGHENFEEKWNPAMEKPWYFNCGVMVINVKKWRETIDRNEWWNVVSEYRKYDFKVIEQDALNYFFRGTQLPLNPELNSYPSEYGNDETAVVHFAGHHKPWNFRPRFLRLREKQNVRISMEIWDSLEKEVFEQLSAGLTEFEIARIREKYPKVKLSTKLSIFFPTLTRKLYSIKQVLIPADKK